MISDRAVPIDGAVHLARVVHSPRDVTSDRAVSIDGAVLSARAVPSHKRSCAFRHSYALKRELRPPAELCPQLMHVPTVDASAHRWSCAHSRCMCPQLVHVPTEGAVPTVDACAHRWSCAHR